MTRQRLRWRLLFAAGVALTMLAAACADDDDSTSTEAGGGGGGNQDLSGKTVTVFGPEVEGELQGLQDTFKPFENDTGVTVKVSGDRSFEQQIGSQVDGGNPPDIAMFPQPGKVKDFADDIITLPDEVASEVKDNFDAGWTDLVTIDGDLKAVPAKADLKSLVWYSPQAFKDGGYEVPKTQDDFLALADKMVADGKTPFCIGLGSDAATGWPYTDWIEDYMLRLKGPDTYDKWRDHEIAFNDPDVVEVGEYVTDLLSKNGYVFGGLKNAASRPFADAGLPVLDGDCEMYRMGNFYAANWPKGTTLGEDGDVNAFFLPGSDDNPNITLSGGIYAAAFADRPEVVATMKYIASTDFADTRAPVGGFLSPNKNVDTSKYPTPLEQSFGQILADANPVRFDASDVMPGEVGAGTFWSACVDITSGSKTVEQAFTEVEDTWPS